MLTRWSTFTLWALVAASAVYWGLRVFVQPAPAPAGTVVATAEGPLRGELQRLLGADPAPIEQVEVAVADPRFQLLGVLSAPGAKAEREGVALIAVDDGPPRAYRVGMAVDGDTVLQAVHPRGAQLGPRGGLALVALELPPPAAAATGSLPGLGGGAAGSAGNAAGTQVFMPPGQPAPNFTRNRTPAAGMTPPPSPYNLPVPPPALSVPVDTGSDAEVAAGGLRNLGQQDPGETADDASSQGPNPLR